MARLTKIVGNRDLLETVGGGFKGPSSLYQRLDMKRENMYWIDSSIVISHE